MAEAKGKRLTQLQRRFCHHVALGRTQTDALRLAGWKGKRPDVKGSKLMALPHVREHAEKLKQDDLATAGVTRAMIANELRRLAFVDPRKLENADGTGKPLSELDDDTAAAVASVEFEELFEGHGEKRERIGRVRKLKTWNKREALSELAAIAGMKRNDGAPPAVVGPGLTVIVQQGVQVQGQQVVQSHRVEVQLPRPGGST